MNNQKNSGKQQSLATVISPDNRLLASGSQKTALILGGDGYLGWPTAMHFAKLGYRTVIVDNLAKRLWESEVGSTPLFHIPTLKRRVKVWNDLHSDKKISVYVVDIAHNHRMVYRIFEEVRPDVVIHYAEQPSAPYSMHNRYNAVNTQVNNVVGTLNVMFAMLRYTPDAHMIKLGTMGEYGTPNIDIEEGWLELEYNGRRDRMLYPKKPGSFYHLSKVHDSHNLEFACRIWGLRVTDLNQGVVYGIETDETQEHPELITSFHYDQVFGTVINRFVTQAVSGIPLTVYGNGSQTRGYLNLRDTISCVTLAAKNPPKSGEFRVFNQFTEQFSVQELADKVKRVGDQMGLNVQIKNIENPRVEQEDHHYNAKHTKLLDLGLKPHYLTDEWIATLIKRVADAKDHIDSDTIMPTIKWQSGGSTHDL